MCEPWKCQWEFTKKCITGLFTKWKKDVILEYIRIPIILTLHTSKTFTCPIALKSVSLSWWWHYVHNNKFISGESLILEIDLSTDVITEWREIHEESADFTTGTDWSFVSCQYGEWVISKRLSAYCLVSWPTYIEYKL